MQLPIIGVCICPLELRVEVFAGLQGSSQHCSLWVDPHVLLRPAEEFSDRRGESMNKLSKVRSRQFVCIPSKDTATFSTPHAKWRLHSYSKHNRSIAENFQQYV